MRNTFQVARATSPGSDRSDGSSRVRHQRIVAPIKFTAFTQSFEKKEQSWYVTSQIPTDLRVHVQDMTFHVHKYPLLSRSGYVSRLTFLPNSNYEYDLKLDNLPGGAETFELILKYCYGLPIDLTPMNIVPLRCASEFLEMTEDLEEGNLVSKTEAFLRCVVLCSWRHSITVLKSCESLSPWPESLQIVRRCTESIALKVSMEHTGFRDSSVNERWWFNDLSTLRINHFVRIITILRAKGLPSEIIGGCIENYAFKWLPGRDRDGERQGEHGCGRSELQLSILSGRKEEGGGVQNKEERMMIESLVSIIPPDRKAVSCGFLLWMLKMAVVYWATPALVSELEKRVGMVLEDATVGDLLIPNYIAGDGASLRNYPVHGVPLHDVDAVQRIIEYFLMHEQQNQEKEKSAKVAVAKLIDNYLAEIASDPDLSVAKFQALAETLPENVRACDDGLYRAIDTYIKAHPSITEHERRRLCRAMDCEKLSSDARLHAAQNERLPLRTVVLVLFTEQAKLRATMQTKGMTPRDSLSEKRENWASTNEQVKVITGEVEKMKTMLTELLNNYAGLQQEVDKLLEQKTGTGWSAGWAKKIKHSMFFFHGKMDKEEIELKQNQRSRRRFSIS